MKNQIKTPWGGGIKSLKPRRAFTLAEVLITLAVIGIVAALTIPTLVSKNQNKQLYIQFMKSYNTISNAANFSILDNGVVLRDLGQYFKNTKVCNNDNNYCGYDVNKVIKILVNSDIDYYFQFSDGSFILSRALQEEGNLNPYFYVDINGLRGPNSICFDFFKFELDSKTGKITGGSSTCIIDILQNGNFNHTNDTNNNNKFNLPLGTEDPT